MCFCGVLRSNLESINQSSPWLTSRHKVRNILRTDRPAIANSVESYCHAWLRQDVVSRLYSYPMNWFIHSFRSFFLESPAKSVCAATIIKYNTATAQNGSTTTSNQPIPFIREIWKRQIQNNVSAFSLGLYCLPNQSRIESVGHHHFGLIDSMNDQRSWTFDMAYLNKSCCYIEK